MVVGHHLLADFHGIAAGRLDDAVLLTRCLEEAARAGGMHPVAAPVLHHFPGGGLTGFLLLSESHIAFHTYPERGFVALDIFSCGNADAGAALDVFRQALAPGRERVTTAPRGD